jgi:hypothetical protein
MELIRKYRFEIAALVIIIILVIIRSVGVNHFRSDAKKWVEPTLNHVNIVAIEQVSALSGNNLLVRLDKDDGLNPGLKAEQLIIPADSILDKKIIRRILKFNGNILLKASDPGLSARIWMILSQMGCKKIFILSDLTDNESLKYKFRPDSMPETNRQ